MHCLLEGRIELLQFDRDRFFMTVRCLFVVYEHYSVSVAEGN